MQCSKAVGVVLVLSAGNLAAQGQVTWNSILQENFDADPSGNWSYAGQLNGSSQALIRWDSTNGRLAVEWDQSNNYAGSGDPYTIQPSRYARSLPVTLDDSQTFKFGAKLRISSAVDTTEFYQVANVGLYNLSQMGDDRTMSDNLSGNTNAVKDASDFVEFNYFIQNKSWGFNPMTQATVGAHITGTVGDYTVGSGIVGDALWHDTDMGADHWLPLDTDLFVEVIYYGAETGAKARRAHSAIYTDPARTTLLSVNGVQQYYWTQALPTDDHFALTDAGGWNYVGENWDGTNGAGSGTLDDFYVMEEVPEPAGGVGLLCGWLVATAARRRRPRGQPTERLRKTT